MPVIQRHPVRHKKGSALNGIMCVSCQKNSRGHLWICGIALKMKAKHGLKNVNHKSCKIKWWNPSWDHPFKYNED